MRWRKTRLWTMCTHKPSIGEIHISEPLTQTLSLTSNASIRNASIPMAPLSALRRRWRRLLVVSLPESMSSNIPKRLHHQFCCIIRDQSGNIQQVRSRKFSWFSCSLYYSAPSSRISLVSSERISISSSPTQVIRMLYVPYTLHFRFTSSNKPPYFTGSTSFFHTLPKWGFSSTKLDSLRYFAPPTMPPASNNCLRVS